MYRKISIIISMLILLNLSLPALAANSKTQQLELFGVPLKGVMRDKLRQVLKKGGMIAKREDSDYFVDIYDSSRVLDGSSDFEVGYVQATHKFAFAQYTFKSFMNTQLVEKVINMVSSKYGQPSSVNGSYDLGAVSAKWYFSHGMQIEVSRGWPDTTTYLTYRDISANDQMEAEIEAIKKAQEQKQAKSQNGAF